MARVFHPNQASKSTRTNQRDHREPQETPVSTSAAVTTNALAHRTRYSLPEPIPYEEQLKQVDTDTLVLHILDLEQKLTDCDDKLDRMEEDLERALDENDELKGVVASQPKTPTLELDLPENVHWDAVDSVHLMNALNKMESWGKGVMPKALTTEVLELSRRALATINTLARSDDN